MAVVELLDCPPYPGCSFRAHAATAVHDAGYRHDADPGQRRDIAHGGMRARLTAGSMDGPLTARRGIVPQAQDSYSRSCAVWPHLPGTPADSGFNSIARG